jgi:hypothetical protein
MASTDPTNIDVPNSPTVLLSNSSAVVGYSYDATNYVLDVWFKGKSQPIYRYYLVYPPVMSQIFDSGSGHGLKLRNLTKGLRYVKLR